MESRGAQFLVYDAGISATIHDDHRHYHESEPGLTALAYPAAGAGHVVPHAGKTVLWADETGTATTVATDDIATADASVQVHQSEAPHHGVGVALADGGLLATEGTADARTTVTVFDGADRRATTDQCPGSHGEATAAPNAGGDVVVIGCQNGPVIWKDGAFHKVAAPTDYARTGNLAGHPESAVVLSDMKTDADAAQEHPTQVALIDTATATLATVELGSTYWFRSLARGENGEALVLTADGSLRILDADGGAQLASVPVIEPWEEHEDWQQPGPALIAQGDVAYISDPVAEEIVLVDLAGREVIARFTAPAGVTEMAVVTGKPTAPGDAHDH